VAFITCTVKMGDIKAIEMRLYTENLIDECHILSCSAVIKSAREHCWPSVIVVRSCKVESRSTSNCCLVGI